MTAPAPQGDPAGTITDPAAAADPAAGAPADDKLGDPGLKALQTEREARAAAEAKVREFEKAAADAARAKLSEQERIAADLADHKTGRETAERELTRLRVALEKAVPAEWIDRLIGSTREELEADADKLLASLQPKEPAAPAPPGGGRPTPVLRGGGDPTAVGDPKIADILANVPRFGR